MFGFSLFKIIFTAVIVYVVWNAFKVFNRAQDQRAERARMHGAARGKMSSKPSPRSSSKASAKPSPQPTSSTDDIEDMVECAACGAYVTRGTKSCGRDDCPFLG